MEKPKNAVKVKLIKKKKYSFCTCGKSDTMPYCDNSHRLLNEEKGTDYKSLKVFPDEDTTMWISSSIWENTEK
jgi:CDGSH-type Zn-finger protein